MKITPFVLFLILLFALTLSLIFNKITKHCVSSHTEGFVSFSSSVEPLKNVRIPQYSSAKNTSVVKLHDNVFYDVSNGNVIEVNSLASSDVDMFGETINEIYVVTRDGNINKNKYFTQCIDLSGVVTPPVTTPPVTTPPVTTPPVTTPPITTPPITTPTVTTPTVTTPTPSTDKKESMTNEKKCKNGVKEVDTEESKINQLTSTTKSWFYDTQTKETDKYTVCYMPCEKYTAIHIINTTNKMNTSSFLFTPSGQNFIFKHASSPLPTAKTIVDTNTTNNGFLVLDPSFNTTEKLLQITSHTRFNPKTKELLILDSQNKMSIYDQTGKLKQNDASTNKPIEVTPDFTFQPYVVNDANNNMILNMQLDTNKTLIATITLLNENKCELSNVFCIDPATISTKLKEPPTSPKTPETTTNFAISGNITLDMLKQLMFEKDDYILKTQIVPPVYPSQCADYNKNNNYYSPSTNNADTTQKPTTSTTNETTTFKPPSPQTTTTTPPTQTTNTTTIATPNFLSSLFKRDDTITTYNPPPTTTNITNDTSTQQTTNNVTPQTNNTNNATPQTMNTNNATPPTTSRDAPMTNTTESNYIPITADFSSFGR